MKTPRSFSHLVSFIGLCGVFMAGTPSTVGSDVPADQLELVPIFGPERFVRTTGGPQTVTRNFDASGFLGPFWLCVENGSGRKDRISSGVLTLNGQTLVYPDAFNQKVALIEKEIGLLELNCLRVQLRGRPGSSITVTILGALHEQQNEE